VLAQQRFEQGDVIFNILVPAETGLFNVPVLEHVDLDPIPD